MTPADLFIHPQFTQLDPSARVIFIDVCKHHNGSNNGVIGYGCAAGARAANVSPATANRRLNELRRHGLLKLRKEGAFNVKDREKQSREWEITIYPIAGRLASINWLFSERRIKFEHWLLESAPFVPLRSAAKCTFFELMRRYDGNNNCVIAFGGKDGAYVGCSRDVTERALTELAEAGFIVETAPADPRNGVPRKWRLTIYNARGEPASKDFMRPAKPDPKKSFHGITSADDKALNVSLVRTTISPKSPAPISAANETGSVANQLLENQPISDIRISDTFAASDIRAGDMHIETSLPAEGRLLDCLPISVPLVQRSPEATRPAMLPYKALRRQASSTVHGEPADLFGDALPSLLTRQDELRVKLRSTLSRRRGTQSRLAAAVGLSRSTFAHALSGRCGFTPTAAAALRIWLDGHPMAGQWPALPPALEDNNAA